MIIERIGVNAPLAAYGLDANAVPIVPTGPDASYVVAWYDFSAQPGTGGQRRLRRARDVERAGGVLQPEHTWRQGTWYGYGTTAAPRWSTR